MADYTSAASTSGQILSTGGMVGLVFLIAFVAEALYTATKESAERFQTLIDYTASAEDMTLVIHQDQSKYPDAKPIGLSMNERTGIEFAYSFYLYVHPSTFTGNAVLKHVFHKGYGCPWPLMGPGVFIKGETNAMRIFMNTYANPYSYVDINNIPVQKWFHVVLNCYKGGLDVFVNGHLANRVSFRNTLPYQNFQDIILFSNANYNRFKGSTIPALKEENFDIEGSFRGYLSNLIYARYALSVSEIQNLMHRGPASKLKQKNLDKPPYLADDWWAHQT